MSRIRRRFEQILEPAGIRLDGSDPWDIQVHNPDLFMRIVREGTLGLGEAYMDGWWDCEALDQKHVPVTCKLWDRVNMDEPGVLKTPDGKRRLSAPVWEPDMDIDEALDDS